MDKPNLQKTISIDIKMAKPRQSMSSSLVYMEKVLKVFSLTKRKVETAARPLDTL
jgi:hypothetical protein